VKHIHHTWSVALSAIFRVVRSERATKPIKVMHTSLSAKEHREHQSNHCAGGERNDRWLWKTEIKALRTTAMRFGIQGTNRPRNRDDEGDPHVGEREGDRWCMQCGPD